MKRIISIFLMSALLFLALPTSLSATESQSEQPIIVYLDGVNGNDQNNGNDSENALCTLEAAYEKLLIADQGSVKNDSNAVGVILISGSTTISNGFNTGLALKHTGTVLITSKYEQEDYSDIAKLMFSQSGEQAIQLGGPTIIEHLTLNRTSTSAYTIYAVKSLTMGEGVINQCNSTSVVKNADSASMQGKCIVRGGFFDANYTDDIVLNIISGTYWFVSGANARSGAVNGNVDITVGGNAWVATVVSGTQATISDIPSSRITVADSAFIHTVAASGDVGIIPNSEIVLAGGTVDSLLTTRSGKSGTVKNFTLTITKNSEMISANDVTATSRHLVFDGGEHNVSLNTGWNAVTIKNNCEAILSGTWPGSVNLTVEYGSTLHLSEGESLSSWLGCGSVYFGQTERQNDHNWDNKIVQEPTETESGELLQTCTLCGTTQTAIIPPYNPLNQVVFVDGTISASGDGTSSNKAKKTLEEAYEKLLGDTNNSIKTSANAAATIVLSGEVVVDGKNFNLGGTYEHIGKVTITSVYNSIDYHDSKGARLSIGSASDTAETRFQCGGPTEFRDIILHRLNKPDGSAGKSLTIYGANELVMGVGVETSNTNWSTVSISKEDAAKTKLSAHQGYQPAAPANSIPAFIAAGELGYWAIETDVYTTKDGYLVCLHDSEIDSAFNGSGSVKNMTLAQLYNYKIDVGNNVNLYTDYELRIPLFSEYLEICKEYGALPFIEMKDASVATVIAQAREYFDDKDIIISSFTLSHLQQARAISDDIFVHHIWSSENTLPTLSALGNSGTSYNIASAQLSEASVRATAKGMIDRAHQAGVEICLRAGDDLNTIQIMNELGVNYIPTNLTTPEMLYNPVTSSGGGKIFIRGGYGYKATSEDTSITALSGQYDFVAASNAEQAATGTYKIAVGGNAFVSRLIAGATSNTTTSVASSSVDISGNATVKELYTIGDFGTTNDTRISLSGGRVETLTGRRSGKTGLAVNVTLMLEDNAPKPVTVDLSSNAITGAKKFILSGITNRGMAFSSLWNIVTLKDNSAVKLIGIWPSQVQLIVESGSLLITE